MSIVDITSRRIVSRDFMTGTADGIAPETPIRAVSHDFAGHTSQTIRDRKQLDRVRKLRPRLDERTHMQRMLKTEFNGGLVLGFIFGSFFTTVVLALSVPYWAPVVVWMVQP